jgi:hypothetical protein
MGRRHSGRGSPAGSETPISEENAVVLPKGTVQRSSKTVLAAVDLGRGTLLASSCELVYPAHRSQSHFLRMKKMKKKSLKKLTLSRESLGMLDHVQLRDAVGGTNTNTCMSLCGAISLCMAATKCTAWEEEE